MKARLIGNRNFSEYCCNNKHFIFFINLKGAPPVQNVFKKHDITYFKIFLSFFVVKISELLKIYFDVIRCHALELFCYRKKIP